MRLSRSRVESKKSPNTGWMQGLCSPFPVQRLQFMGIEEVRKEAEKPAGHKLGLINLSWVTWRMVYDVERPETPDDCRNITEEVFRGINRCTCTTKTMEPNIRSMLDRLTIHWSTKCSMEMMVNRTHVTVVVAHVQTINMESRCV